MTIRMLATAAAALAFSIGAQASVVATVNAQSATTFLLDTSNTTGTTLRTSAAGDAAMPTDTVGAFLAAQTYDNALVTFAGGVYSVSFEWGTPDATWNTLVVNLSDGTGQSFTSGSGSLALSGDTYVNFAATGGLKIDSLQFLQTSNPAFEAVNFKVSAVPEPTNIALLLAGLGLMGVVARRRRG